MPTTITDVAAESIPSIAADIVLSKPGAQQRRTSKEISPVTQAQLEDIVPCSAISRHLAELAHLYEATSPIIANIYVLIASLSPESLPQGSTGAARAGERNCSLSTPQQCSMRACVSPDRRWKVSKHNTLPSDFPAVPWHFKDQEDEGG